MPNEILMIQFRFLHSLHKADRDRKFYNSVHLSEGNIGAPLNAKFTFIFITLATFVNVQITGLITNSSLKPFI